MLYDTIAAIATAPGEGAVGIIRISGNEAIELIDQIFVSPKGKKLIQMQGFTMAYGHIFDETPDEVIDEVIVSVMRGPKSFTAEDTVEISCHGGMVPLKKTLERVLELGIRLAEPGEFTKRAFLNGRLDLAQAESVIDVIRSKTEVSLDLALQQLKGRVSQEVEDIRYHVLEILAFIEAGIDFPEDEVESLGNDDLSSRLEHLRKRLGIILSTAESGRILRDGLKVAIIGKPNVGKSSLLNALLKENRAIVTDIPGTTRDVIEEFVNIKGVPVRIIDTAGIRETVDYVEKIGVEKSREVLNEADLVLMVIDITNFGDRDQEIIEQIKGKPVLVILNKVDLMHGEVPEIADLANLQRVYLSVVDGSGLSELEDNIVKFVWDQNLGQQPELLIANTRHKEALKKAYKAVVDVEKSLQAGMSGDFLSIDLKAAWEYLGEITGGTVGEDLIDEIFSRFCLGK